MTDRRPKEVSYIVLSKDKIDDLENYCGGVELRCFGIDKTQKNEIKKNINFLIC